MSYQASDEIISRLRWHAGLEGAHHAAPSIADCTGPAGAADRLDEALGDLLEALAQLNRELNGPIPSATTDGADQIPRPLVYAVAEITRMLREQPDYDDAAWSVDTAWAAILAGDIDDLDEHLHNERR